MSPPRALVIRQQEEALPLAKALREKGVEPYLYPLFTPHFLPLPPLENPQGFIITSKNALRALEGREELKKLPLYVVGDQTAQFAKAMGFSTVFNASGTSKELISLILQKASHNRGVLWHLSGDVIRGNIVETLKKEGFESRRYIIYHLKERDDLPLALVDDLHHQRLSHVLFFSPRTTTAFVNLLKKNGLETLTAPMTSLCLSQNVVEKALSLNWKKVWVSPRPTVQDMIGYFNEK